MTSQYKGVYFQGKTDRKIQSWIAQYMMPNGKKWICRNITEREAAIAYDKKMIALGKEPVNILKPKTK